MKNVMFAASLLALAGAASAAINVSDIQAADMNRMWNLDGTPVNQQAAGGRVPDGTTYTAFTGLATSSGGLVLLENGSAPVRDDIVTWDGTSEAINDYITAPATTRTVNETTTVGVSSSVLAVTISGSADLFPAGFAIGGTPLTRAGIGLGLNLGAALGNDTLLWGAGATVPVTQGRINFLDANGGSLSGGFLTLPLATFFGNGNWNGVLGIVFNSATGLGVRSVVLEITTTKIPTPGSAGLLAIGGLVAARRRRA